MFFQLTNLTYSFFPTTHSSHGPNCSNVTTLQNLHSQISKVNRQQLTVSTSDDNMNFEQSYHWAEARVKIARMTLTIKLDRNWSSFQLANSAPPLSVTDSAIAPSARMDGGFRVQMQS